MVLIPIERLKAYEKKSTETSKMPPDIELKLLRQQKVRSKRKHSTSSPQKTISLEQSIETYAKPDKSRAIETLKHLKENKDRLTIDKNT